MVLLLTYDDVTNGSILLALDIQEVEHTQDASGVGGDSQNRMLHLQVYL